MRLFWSVNAVSFRAGGGSNTRDVHPSEMRPNAAAAMVMYALRAAFLETALPDGDFGCGCLAGSDPLLSVSYATTATVASAFSGEVEAIVEDVESEETRGERRARARLYMRPAITEAPPSASNTDHGERVGDPWVRTCVACSSPRSTLDASTPEQASRRPFVIPPSLSRTRGAGTRPGTRTRATSHRRLRVSDRQRRAQVALNVRPAQSPPVQRCVPRQN